MKRILVVLIVTAKPGLGAFITAVKLTQLPKAEKIPATAIISKKFRKLSATRMVFNVPKFKIINPKRTNPNKKSNICFEEKPLLPRCLVHKTNPAKHKEVKIEYKYHGICIILTENRLLSEI